MHAGRSRLGSRFSSKPLFLVCLLAIFAALPGQASAYLTAVSVTTEDPSRIASYSLANDMSPTPVRLSTVEFPLGATDTRLIGLGFRPQSEDLYALGSGGTLYALQGPPPFKAVQINPTPAVSPLEGTAFGVGFNPVEDAMAAIDDAGQSLLLSPFNGDLLSSDGTLAYAPGDPNAGVTPIPAAAGFTEAVPGAQSTTMYVIDSATDSLAIQGPEASPDAGAGAVLHTVGDLGFDVTAVGGFGFDASQIPNEGNYALLNSAEGGPTKLCGISLRDVYGFKGGIYFHAGQANCSSTVGGAGELEGLAVVPPSSVGFTDRVFIHREGHDVPTVEVGRTGALRRAATISYGAVPILTDPSLGGISGTVTFAPGQTRRVLDLSIPDDKAFQPARNLELRLSATGPDTVVTSEASIADVHVVDDEPDPSLRPKIKKPGMKLGRVLGGRRLVVRYRCKVACRATMSLAVAGTQIAHYKGGPAPGSRAAVFKLGPKALSAIREQVRHGTVALHLSASFRLESERFSEALDFRLRR